jgi:hypothetical protein
MNLHILILIILAAFLNAVMDLLENENFSSSVFKHLNPRWWYKRESWKYAKKILGWKYDGWHVAKSLMIFCICTMISSSIIQWVLYGILWNISFSLSYKLLKK